MTVAASIDRIYMVRSGDSLSKIAQAFYGDASLYPMIATKNKINPQGVLLIGQKLVLPPKPEELQEVTTTAMRLPETIAPSSPGGSVPAPYSGGMIETVMTTASVWYKDWRYWAGIVVVGGVVWYLTRRK